MRFSQCCCVALVIAAATAQTTTYTGTECATVFASTQVLSTPRLSNPETNLALLNRLLISSRTAACRAALKDIGCNAVYATSCPADSLWTTAYTACGSTTVTGSVFNLYDQGNSGVGGIKGYVPACDCSYSSSSSGCTVTTSGTATGSGEDSEIGCPSPLIPFTDSIAQNLDGTSTAGSACSYPCYVPIYSDDQVDSHISLLDSMAWISFFLSVILIIINTLPEAEYRLDRGSDAGKESYVKVYVRPWLLYPMRLQLYFTFCVAMASFSLTFGTFVGDDKKLWCDSAHKHTCKAQGSLLEFFGMAAAIWWLFISLNAYLTIVAEQTLEQTERYERYYHIVAWGLPCVFLFFILLPADKIGFPGYSSMWCWVDSDDSAAWQFAFFYTEVGLFCLIGFCLFVRIAHKLYQDAGGHMSKTDVLKKLGALLTFIFVYILLYGWMFGYRVNLQANRTDYKDAFSTYAACLASAWGTSSFTQSFDHSSCSITDKPAVELWYFQTVNLAGLGIFTFFIFGIQAIADRYRAWRDEVQADKDGEELAGVEIFQNASVTGSDQDEKPPPAATAGGDILKQSTRPEDSPVQTADVVARH